VGEQTTQVGSISAHLGRRTLCVYVRDADELAPQPQELPVACAVLLSDLPGPPQPCGWLMLTIQGIPKRSVHMPKTSPHICFSRDTATEPPAESFSQ
jgi:hypothetical protein